MIKFRKNNARPVWYNHTGLTRINYKERYTYRDVAHFMYRKITNAHGDHSINNAERQPQTKQVSFFLVMQLQNIKEKINSERINVINSFFTFVLHSEQQRKSLTSALFMKYTFNHEIQSYHQETVKGGESVTM